MCGEFESHSEMQFSRVNALPACVSDYEVLPVPIPGILQVPGPAETLAVQSDEYTCIDYNRKQEKKANMLTTYNLVSITRPLIILTLNHVTLLLRHPCRHYQ